MEISLSIDSCIGRKLFEFDPVVLDGVVIVSPAVGCEIDESNWL